MTKPDRILISRTDSIGDVMLTLPLCGYLARQYPGAEINFLGRSYTVPILKSCKHVSRILNWDEVKKLPDGDAATLLRDHADVLIHAFPQPVVARLAKKAGIPLRIGTTGRFFHWLNCNKLVAFSRKRSGLHESQLNFQLLRGFGIKHIPNWNEIRELYGFETKEELPARLQKEFQSGKKHIILHPKSQGSAVEWSASRFLELIDELPSNEYKIFLTGTEREGQLCAELIEKLPEHAIPMFGKMSLSGLIVFIDHCDGLVAASTGPLHIAAALGKCAIGLFSDKRPIHPGRWGPVGVRARAITATDAELKENPGSPIEAISAQRVAEAVKKCLAG